jgi:hypothetical protein
MAELSAEQRANVSGRLQRLLSDECVPVGITKGEFLGLVERIDRGLAAAEQGMLEMLPDEVRAWVEARRPLGRRLQCEVARERQERL